MMSFIEVPATCGVIFYFIYLVFELFVRRKERIMMLEKMGQGHDLSGFKPNFPNIIGLRSFTSLKIGCLLIGLGLGLLIGFFIYLNVRWSFEGASLKVDYEMKSVIYGAPVLLFGGLGLIVAYLIENKTRGKNGE